MNLAWLRTPLRYDAPFDCNCTKFVIVDVLHPYIPSMLLHYISPNKYKSFTHPLLSPASLFVLQIIQYTKLSSRKIVMIKFVWWLLIIFFFKKNQASLVHGNFKIFASNCNEVCIMLKALRHCRVILNTTPPTNILKNYAGLILFT